MKPQVTAGHYEFGRYISKRRWASMWHQVDELFSVDAKRVLEVGPGPGIFKAVGTAVGMNVETLDIDPEVSPDHLALAEKMPFNDGEFDAVCAFQMLEHVPYKTSIAIFSEMCRVGRGKVVISLPDARPAWPYALYIPGLGDVHLVLRRPWLGPAAHHFNGEHYWEVNTKDTPLSRVVSDFSCAGAMMLDKTYRVPECPYHRFFVFSPEGR